jgi:16S rRNA A1518/A1519 N6-dimethyltransferase RsmA/KsgA/DIM1 with predicted DNA glycosylase/AP lyase activity
MIFPLLEFGAGTGNISELLSAYRPLCLTDTDARMLAHLKKKFSHINDVSVDFLDITQPPPEQMVESFRQYVKRCVKLPSLVLAPLRLAS